jgi:hypothetical protein
MSDAMAFSRSSREVASSKIVLSNCSSVGTYDTPALDRPPAPDLVSRSLQMLR